MSGLVNGLQNRVHPFESGRHLSLISKGSTILSIVGPFFYYISRLNQTSTHNGITDQLKLRTYVQQPMHVRPLPYARTSVA